MSRGREGCRQGRILWLTGVPASGKTTLARAAEERLRSEGLPVVRLDGDELRAGLNSDLGFSRADREENVRRILELAVLLSEAGFIVLVAVVSPFRTMRGQARRRLGPERFCEVYVHASPEECARRDPKGLYARARAGQLTGLTGFDAPYEEPLSPEIEIATESLTVSAGVDRLCAWLAQH